MKKIIGRGVLLLNSANENGLKFGFELSTDGILLSPLGENASLQSISKTIKRTHNIITGSGHIILNALPASPNDAFYDVTFEAMEIGYAAESYKLFVKSPSTPGNEAFAHGPQYYFSGLDLTYSYENIGNTRPSVVTLDGNISLHLDQGVFENWTKLEMTLDWNVESDTLIFSNADHKFPMDTIGELSKIGVELGQPYDRWAQVQGLYTFDGVTGDISTHDISGQGAPSLYFRGDENFNEEKYKKDNPDDKHPYPAIWNEEGRGIALDGGVLASRNGITNSVVDSILQTESFSVEMWITPSKNNHKEKAWIFAFNGKTVGSDYPYNFYLGQGPWHVKGDKPSSFARANFKFPPLGKPAGVRSWEYPLESPANSMTEEQMHLVYSCSKDGIQRIYINGVQVVERHNPDYLNTWGGNLRMIIGSDIPHMTPGNIYKGQPWKGEIHHLAIYNRALTTEEVNLHYLPVVKITGDISLDNMIAPLADEVFPFHLTTSEDTAALVASREVEFNIKPQLGFRKIEIDCSKLKEDPWAFSGKFQTIFWEDFFELHASLYTPEEGDVNLLELNSRGEHAQPINLPGLGYAKYKDIMLRIGKHDPNNVWELSFGAHEEFGLISMVLENAVPEYGNFIMGNTRLILTEPINLKGNWIGEEMNFVGDTTNTFLMDDFTPPDLPFTLLLPPDPDTVDSIGEAISLTDVLMTITLEVKLQKEGFLGILNVSFPYEGETLSLPERRLYNPPPSKMALLGDILEEVKGLAHELFPKFRRHDEDYYLGKYPNTDDPNIEDQLMAHLRALNMADPPIKYTLPRIFKDNPPSGFKSTTTNPVLELDQTDDDCTLTINLASGDLRTAFDNLLEEVEGESGLTSGGLRLLRNSIAERLPASSDDSLYYHYGWNRTENYIDLHPGMRLRVDFQNYQFVHVTDQKAKKGFAGAGSIYIPINSYTHNDDDNTQYLGFGSFLSRLDSDSEGDLSEDGAGGLVDLLKVGVRKPFFRLFFPKKTTDGTASEQSVTIVGANNFKDLPIDIPLEADSTGNVVSFFFRDKAMVIPEIQVFVGNKETYVPVGTTMRQLIEKYANIPMPNSELQLELQAYLGKDRPRRLIHEGANNTPAYRFLNVNSNDVLKNQDIFDLPLIKGDKFYF